MTETITPSAALGLYDWPEIQSATDELWQHLRQPLERAGLEPPVELDRKRELNTLWLDPGLVLAQTCGFPYLTCLASATTLLGTPVYAVDGAQDGFYSSVVLAHRDDPRSDIADFAGSTVAINGIDSQSGFNALRLYLAAQHAPVTSHFFKSTLISGSHRNSVHCVASHAAAVCAVDPVSWALACEYNTDITSQLRIIGETPPTPALPLICSNRMAANVDMIALSSELRTCIDALPDSISRSLYLQDLVPLDDADYEQLKPATDTAIGCGFGQLSPDQPAAKFL